MATSRKRSLWRTLVIVLVNLVLVALIIALTLANWMPAIYRSEWYKGQFGS